MFGDGEDNVGWGDERSHFPGNLVAHDFRQDHRNWLLPDLWNFFLKKLQYFFQGSLTDVEELVQLTSLYELV